MTQTEDTVGEISATATREKDENDFRRALNVCGLDDKAIDGVRQNWFKNLSEMAEIRNHKELSEIFRSTMDYPGDDPRYFYIFSRLQRNLQALHYWLKHHKVRRKPIQIEDWTPEALVTAQKQSRKLQNKEDFKSSIKPHLRRTKINKGYFSWKHDFLRYLNGQDSRLGMCIGLDYVVRPEKNPEDPIPACWDADLFEYPLEGREYDYDNSKVALLLRSELRGTEAYAPAKNALDSNDGRQAMLNVIHYYENPQRAFAAASKVMNLIDQLEYTCNEDVFKFEDYSLNLIHLFNILSNYPEYEMKDSHKKDILFRHIDDSDAPESIRIAISTVQSQRIIEGNTKSFSDYYRMLRNAIECVHFQDLNSRPRKRKRKNYSAANFYYNPHFRYSSINGVDLRDINDNFSRNDWSRLGIDGQQYVLQRREILELGEIE